MPRLGRKFYSQDTIVAAREMLGKHIVRKIGNKTIRGKIVEVEAYIGPEDRASHAYKGKRTPRNEAEYLIGGHIYIYLVYGMYWQLNISTSGDGVPECVLIRALEPISNAEMCVLGSDYLSSYGLGVDKELKNLTNGPGKLCRYLKVDKSFYGVDVCTSKDIWLEDKGGKVEKKDIVAASRVGIDYAGQYWAKRKWRFYIKNNPFVSKI